MAFMHEVTIGPLTMLVFSEAIMRTLDGKVRVSTVEAHLALWKGHRKYLNNEVGAYKYALKIAERYNRIHTHELLRRKLADTHNITVPALNAPAAKQQSIESRLFTESDKIMYITPPQLITEVASISDMKKKIQELIKSADEEIIRKIFSFLSRDNKDYDKALAVMTSIGIPEKHARVVLDNSLETGDFDAFSKYMLKRTMTLAKLASAGDLISATKAAIPTMSNQFASWLINYQWPATPSMGAGEAALIILLKDGNKPAKGDVGIGNRELEVKGENGRLKGQHGYGTGDQASTVFYEEFTKLMVKVPAKEKISVPRAGGTEYNATKTGKNGWAANAIARVLVANNAATPDEIASIWQKSIGAVFKDMPTNWVRKFVTKSGEVHNITGFLNTWLEESAKYYHKIEGFEAILLLNRKGKFTVIQPSDFAKLGQMVKWTPPNFSSRAGPQGATFGITVK
jgi:hypothetical protein